MRKRKLLWSNLPPGRCLLTHCFVPPACEKLPKGPVVLVTSREGEEGKRKDNHPWIYPYSAAFPYLSFNHLQFLLQALYVFLSVTELALSSFRWGF